MSAEQSSSLDENDIRCDKCGAPVTTGLMAVFCPFAKECEFYVAEAEEFIADLRNGFHVWERK